MRRTSPSLKLSAFFQTSALTCNVVTGELMFSLMGLGLIPLFFGIVPMLWPYCTASLETLVTWCAKESSFTVSTSTYYNTRRRVKKEFTHSFEVPQRYISTTDMIYNAKYVKFFYLRFAQ